MIYLIYSIIILEIILAVFVILGIIKFNNAINMLNDKMLENRYKIRLNAEKIQEEVYEICNTIKICGKRVVKKKNEWIKRLIKSVLISTGLMFISKRYKKQLVYIELALIAYNTYKNSFRV